MGHGRTRVIHARLRCSRPVYRPDGARHSFPDRDLDPFCLREGLGIGFAAVRTLIALYVLPGQNKGSSARQEVCSPMGDFRPANRAA